MTRGRLIVGPDREGRVIPLEGSLVRIGRSPDNEIVLEDASISRYHALLDLDGPRVVLRDTESTCGTWVNGRRISLVVLKGGDRIRFGENLEAVFFPSEPGRDTKADMDVPDVPPERARFLLEGLSEDWLGSTFRPEGGRVVLGRDSGCEIRLPSQAVSRRHAEIVWDGRAAVLRDLDSTNGVFLNGKRVKENPLRPGDEIRIDRFRFRFLHTSTEQEPVAPAPAEEPPARGPASPDPQPLPHLPPFLPPPTPSTPASRPHLPGPGALFAVEREDAQPPCPRTPPPVEQRAEAPREGEPSLEETPSPDDSPFVERTPALPLDPRIKTLLFFIALNLILLIAFLVYYLVRPEPVSEETRPIFPLQESRIEELSSGPWMDRSGILPGASFRAPRGIPWAPRDPGALVVPSATRNPPVIT